MSVFVFGPFQLDDRQKTLCRDGVPICLMPRIYDLLCVLVRHPGALLERSRLLHEVWQGAVIEEGNLSKAVFLLRQALGQIGSLGPYVATVPRRGYRFVAEVNRLEVSGPSVSPDPIPRIVVLPFADVSANADQEYFCKGLAEEIGHALGRVETVRVVSCNSEATARSLNVTWLVTGSVRKSATKLRIVARLVRVADGFQHWSQQFDRSEGDSFSIQEEIAAAIIGAIAPDLLQDKRLVRRSTGSSEAYQHYLRGRFHWSRRPEDTDGSARYHFEEAIRLDPQFAAAHAGLADVYATLGSWQTGIIPPAESMIAARNAARRALELDPGSAEAHASLGYIVQHYEWDLDEADACYRRAINCNPGYAMAHHWRSHCLVAAGRFTESLAESRKALELEPADLLMNVHLAWHCHMAREADGTLEHASRVIHMEPRFHWGHYFLALGLELQGDLEKAIAALHEAVACSSGSPAMKAALGRSLALAGYASEARAVTREVLALGDTRNQFAYEAALVHAVLGELDRSFELLEKARLQRSGWLSYLQVDPRLDPLRADARLQRLAGLLPSQLFRDGNGIVRQLLQSREDLS